MKGLTKNLIMNSALERAVRELAAAPDRLDKPSSAAFCRRMTQVAVISVDTAGMEVTLSGQKGIWVQWP